MTKQTMLLGAVALFGAAAFASETKLLEELVAIPSVSRDIPQVNRAQRHMQAWLEAKGVAVAQALVRLNGKATMRRQYAGEEIPLVRMPAATDARGFYDCGTPVAVIGAKGRGAHAVDEGVSVSGIDAVADLLVDFLGAN